MYLYTFIPIIITSRKHVLDNKWNIPDLDEEQMEQGKIKTLEELRYGEE